MATRRKSIKIFEHERPLLVDAYLRRRIPVDQYESKQDQLVELTDEWNVLTGRQDAPGEVLHYMRSQRKRGLWVRLEGDHESSPEIIELTAEQTEILVGIFHAEVAHFSHGSDILAYEPEVADLIAKEFAAETGVIVPASQLVAKLTAIRKRGLLPKAEEQPKDEKIGFADIDKAVG